MNTNDNNVKDFGLRWNEFNRKDELVCKEKFFATAEKREKFIDKLVEKASFHSVGAFSDPRSEG